MCMCKKAWLPNHLTDTKKELRKLSFSKTLAKGIFMGLQDPRQQ